MKSLLYRSGTGVQSGVSLTDLAEKKNREEVSFWIDVGSEDFGPDAVKEVGDIMDFHPLTVEDILTRESRPIVDAFEDYLYILASSLSSEFSIGELETRQLSIILGNNYVITFHRKDINAIDRATDRFLANPDNYFGRGPDHIVYRILDNVVENHFPILDRIEDEINRIEDEAMEDPEEELFGDIADLRSDLIEVQRTTGPQREMAAKLARAETPYISEGRKIYFRDIQDDLARIHDLLSNYRDLIAGARDTYMNAVSNRMNEIMQTLTIVATIFIPLTFIAGIYGMNFEVMPELGWDWGYYGALGVMGLSAVGMLYYFKRKGWF